MTEQNREQPTRSPKEVQVISSAIAKVSALIREDRGNIELRTVREQLRERVRIVQYEDIRFKFEEEPLNMRRSGRLRTEALFLLNLIDPHWRLKHLNDTLPTIDSLYSSQIRKPRITLSEVTAH